MNSEGCEEGVKRPSDLLLLQVQAGRFLTITVLRGDKKAFPLSPNGRTGSIILNKKIPGIDFNSEIAGSIAL